MVTGIAGSILKRQAKKYFYLPIGLFSGNRVDLPNNKITIGYFNGRLMEKRGRKI